jgi:hypothetical protein
VPPLNPDVIAGAAGGAFSGVYDKDTLRGIVLRVVSGAVLSYAASEFVAERVFQLAAGSPMRMIVASGLGILGIDLVTAFMKSRPRIAEATIARTGIAGALAGAQPDAKEPLVPPAKQPSGKPSGLPDPGSIGRGSRMTPEALARIAADLSRM